MVSLCYHTYSVFMAVYKSVIFVNIGKNILFPMKMIFTFEKKPRRLQFRYELPALHFEPHGNKTMDISI